MSNKQRKKYAKEKIYENTADFEVCNYINFLIQIFNLAIQIYKPNWLTLKPFIKKQKFTYFFNYFQEYTVNELIYSCIQENS